VVARADRLLATDADTDTDGSDGKRRGSAAAAALVAAVRTYERSSW